MNYKSLSKVGGDTINYVKENFILHKDEYVNKELNIILNRLEVPIKPFTTGSDFRYPNIAPFIYVNFYNTNETFKRLDKNVKTARMVVYWDSPLPRDSVVAVLRKSQGVWTDDAKTFFGKRKVKNIEMTKMSDN